VSWRPAVPAVGLYSTVIASKSDGVTPRAPFWGLGHAVTIPGAQGERLIAPAASNAYAIIGNAVLKLLDHVFVRGNQRAYPEPELSEADLFLLGSNR
jgi:hypothetical protein